MSDKTAVMNVWQIKVRAADFVVLINEKNSLKRVRDGWDALRIMNSTLWKPLGKSVLKPSHDGENSLTRILENKKSNGKKMKNKVTDYFFTSEKWFTPPFSSMKNRLSQAVSNSLGPVGTICKRCFQSLNEPFSYSRTTSAHSKRLFISTRKSNSLLGFTSRTNA